MDHKIENIYDDINKHDKSKLNSIVRWVAILLGEDSHHLIPIENKYVSIWKCIYCLILIFFGFYLPIVISF